MTFVYDKGTGELISKPGLPDVIEAFPIDKNTAELLELMDKLRQDLYDGFSGKSNAQV